MYEQRGESGLDIFMQRIHSILMNGGSRVHVMVRAHLLVDDDVLQQGKNGK